MLRTSSGLPATSSITLGMRTLRGWMRRPRPAAASTPIRGAATAVLICGEVTPDKRRALARRRVHHTSSRLKMRSGINRMPSMSGRQNDGT